MTITHSEIYSISQGAPEYMVDLIRKRLKEQYGSYTEERDPLKIRLYAKCSTGFETEEGKNEGLACNNTVCTDGNEQGDQGSDGADGYLGMVNDTWGDPVR